MLCKYFEVEMSASDDWGVLELVELVRRHWSELCSVTLVPADGTGRVSFPGFLLTRLLPARRNDSAALQGQLDLSTSLEYLRAAQSVLRGSASVDDILLVSETCSLPDGVFKFLGLSPQPEEALRRIVAAELGDPSLSGCLFCGAEAAPVIVPDLLFLLFSKLPCRLQSGRCVLVPDLDAVTARTLVDWLLCPKISPAIDYTTRQAAAAHCIKLGGMSVAQKLLGCSIASSVSEGDEICETGENRQCKIKCHASCNLPSESVDLLVNDIGTNITLVPSNGLHIRVHKLVICLYSSYFRHVFRSCRTSAVTRLVLGTRADSEEHHPPSVLQLPTLNERQLRYMVDYMYKGSVVGTLDGDSFRRVFHHWVDFRLKPIETSWNGTDVTSESVPHTHSNSRNQYVGHQMECVKTSIPSKDQLKRQAEGDESRDSVGRPTSLDCVEDRSAASPDDSTGPRPVENGDQDECSGVGSDNKMEVNSVVPSDGISDVVQSYTESGRCEVCGQQFQTPSRLKEHMNRHSGERPFVCATCGLSFASQAGRSHHAHTHRSQRQAVCDVCGKRFTKHGLLSHLKTHSKPFQCDQCGQRFAARSKLNSHEWTRHNTGTGHACRHCGRVFSQKVHLKQHERLHSDSGRLFCRQCKLTFADEARLDTHVALRHSDVRRASCAECGQTFSTRSALIYHRRIHTAEKPFACLQCDRRFTRPDHLATHARVHSGSRPYACASCPLRFASRSGLNRHQNLHLTSTLPAAGGPAGRMDAGVMSEDAGGCLQSSAVTVQQQQPSPIHVVETVDSTSSSVHIQTSAGLVSVHLPGTLPQQSIVAEPSTPQHEITLGSDHFLAYM